MQAHALEGMDIDTPISFNLLSRMQRMNRVGWIAPESLLFGPAETLHQIPIKAPHTPVVIPDWAAPCEAFQKITDHRFATSSLADEQWWHMVYHRYHTVSGQPARVNAGKHFDASDWEVQEGKKLITTSYMVSNTLPVVAYDGVRGFDAELFMRDSDERLCTFQHIANGLKDSVIHELAALRNRFFDPLVYPQGGRCWPAGTITCFNSLNVHEVQIATDNAERGLLHVSMYDGESKAQREEYVRQVNPGLAKVCFR